MLDGKPLRGVFISFEGGDGSGKTTQIRRLADAVQAVGREVVLTREPGGSDGAEAIRALLLEGSADRWSPITEALMMYAARADHLERTIAPALERGAVVITDRFSDSTMAYQGLAGALGEARVNSLHDLVVKGHDPDLTIILDLPIEVGLNRAGARSDKEQRFESKGTDFQKRVRDAFLEIAKRNPERCVVVDASGDIDSVTQRILTETKNRLPSIDI